MRRVTGAVLTGLGAFLVVLAAMARFYLPGQVIKFPLDDYTITTLTGQNFSYFSPSAVYEVTGAKVQAVSTTQGDVAAGSSSVAVWNDITGVFDITNSKPPGTAITYYTERLAFNRRTGELVNCCGAEVGTKRVHFSGLGYLFPLGTQKKTYEVYNTTLLRPVPFRYAGTATVDGLTVYRFVGHISNQQFGTVSLPGSIVNMRQANVTLPEELTATTTDFVDPGTGAPVKTIESQTVSLKNPTTGATALVVLSGTLTSTPHSDAAAVATVSSDDTAIYWVQDIGPLIGVLLGIVLLVVGVLLLNARPVEYVYEDEGDEAVAAGA
jgi:hypothetical protein